MVLSSDGSGLSSADHDTRLQTETDNIGGQVRVVAGEEGRVCQGGRAAMVEVVRVMMTAGQYLGACALGVTLLRDCFVHT